MMSSGKQSATNGKVPSVSDLSAIAALIANNDDELVDENIAELLQQIERADDAMCAVEGRLDSLLEELDSLVQGLEVAHTSNGGQESKSTASAPGDSGVKAPDTPQQPEPGEPART